MTRLAVDRTVCPLTAVVVPLSSRRPITRSRLLSSDRDEDGDDEFDDDRDELDDCDDEVVVSSWSLKTGGDKRRSAGGGD